MNFLEKYKADHQHPVNRALHSIGIPMIVVSLFLPIVSWRWAIIAFVLGWVLQFVGHAFEGKKPSFFSHPGFLLTGPIWWFQKTFFRAKSRD